jgi:glycosyltransferase involved in cell wall biosynthesis
MQGPKVSVIIPVYQVENFLRRCVDSVLGQTLRDIEIILVDDGSPDQCPEICDAYAEAHDNVRVIHKKNGGLSSARNAGMRAASGKYVLFVDSDDWIDPETASELFATAEKYQVDFVRFRPVYAGWPSHQDGTLCDFGTEKGMREGLYTRQDILKEIYPRLFATPQLTLGVIVAAWRSLYNRAFLETNGLYFDEDVRYSEDTIFSARVVSATSSFYYLDGGRYYHYFFNPSSITKSFKADRWESCKHLIGCVERDFSTRADYDFTDQLWLQKLYCVASALRQRSLISDKDERWRYCAKVCGDPVTVEACRHLSLLQVHWKLRVEFMLIRMRAAWLLARV